MNFKFIDKPMDEYEEIEQSLRDEGISWEEDYVDPFYLKYGIRRYDRV